MVLEPELNGSVEVHSQAPRFLEAFRRRVATGLLLGRPHPRSNYSVAESGSDRLRVHAVDWLTAVNVGLNEIDLDLSRPGSVRYIVHYWRWARFVLALGAFLALAASALFLALDLRGYIGRHASAMIPGLSIEENLRVAWAMVLFWGFVWPWLLIAMHKGPVRRLIERLVLEVDAQAGRADGGYRGRGAA